MTTALYYPHTGLRTRSVIKNALLLWDHVECIVPSEDWHDTEPIDQPRYREAVELVSRNRVPTAAEKRRADEKVKEFARTEAPAMLAAALGEGEATRGKEPSRFWRRFPDYLVYPQKFLRETWRELEHLGFARWDEPTSDYGVPPTVGLMMMAILAEECAGTQRVRITDRVRAYSWIEEVRAGLSGTRYVKGLDVSQVAPAHDRFVTLSLEALDARKVSISRLLNLRKRELKGSGGGLRAMRQRYREALDRYVDRVAKEARGPADVQEIERQFKEELRHDLRTLKEELRLNDVSTLFSRDVAFSALALGGALVEPVSGVTALATTLKSVGVAPLVKSLAGYRSSRRRILHGNQMSWLYLNVQ